MDRKCDVVIIGAGIVGCALAYELAQYQLSVAVLEKEADVGWAASKANSGIIHASVHAEPQTLKAKLCREGNELYKELAPKLGVELRKTGMLMVAQSEQQLKSLEEAKKRGRANGEVGLQLLSREELLAKEPALSPAVAGGLFAPSACTIAPYKMTVALFEAAQTNGVKFYFQEPVKEFVLENGQIAAVKTVNLTISTRFVVDAAGLAAGEVAELAGCGFQLLPRAGEEYILDKKVGDIVSHVIFPLPTPTSKGILAIPTADHNLMVGPTASDGVANTHTTPEGKQQVFSFIKKLIPSISERNVIASFAGVRPVSETDDFLIGPTSCTGFFLAAGMQAPGRTAAPAVAKMLTGMLAEAGLKLVKKEQLLPRSKPLEFRELSRQRREELIRQDPAWGRIICRCEEVTEAEIVEAIRRGATTLDGIKFRTRLGMGRCQGGFCTPRVMKIIARELGIPLTAINKRGTGTEVAPLESKQLLAEEDKDELFF